MEHSDHFLSDILQNRKVEPYAYCKMFPCIVQLLFHEMAICKFTVVFLEAAAVDHQSFYRCIPSKPTNLHSKGLCVDWRLSTVGFAC
jgi:hypothetical protein